MCIRDRGNQFLANIRETDAICEVVRYFKDPNVMREVGRTGDFVDPAGDADTIKMCIRDSTEADWTHGAFDGHVDDEYVWGRGALDMSDQVMGNLEAVEYVLGHDGLPERTIIVCMGQDEETLQTGARTMGTELARRGIRCEFSLDEGSYVVSDLAPYGAPGRHGLMVFLAEKGYACLLYTSSFMDAVDGLINGNHLWLFAGNYEKIDACNAVLLQDDYRNDPVIQNALFEAVHRSLYVFANSLAVNGLEHGTSLDMPQPLFTAATDGKAAIMFYADRQFYAKVDRSTGKRFPLRGSWDYTDDGGLALTDVSGEAVEIRCV